MGVGWKFNTRNHAFNRKNNNIKQDKQIIAYSSKTKLKSTISNPLKHKSIISSCYTRLIQI